MIIFFFTSLLFGQAVQTTNALCLIFQEFLTVLGLHEIIPLPYQILLEQSLYGFMAANDLFCMLRIEAQEGIQRVFVGLGMKVRLLTVDNDLLPFYLHNELRIGKSNEDIP